jgi:hypothetical protein
MSQMIDMAFSLVQILAPGDACTMQRSATCLPRSVQSWGEKLVAGL